MKSRDVFTYINSILNLSSSAGSKSAGLADEREITRAFIVKEIDGEIMNEASENSGLIISLNLAKSLESNAEYGWSNVYSDSNTGVTLITVHCPAADAARFQCEALVDALGMQIYARNNGITSECRTMSIARIDSVSVSEFAKNAANQLGAGVSTNLPRMSVSKLAIVPGDGGGYIKVARHAGVGCLLTNKATSENFKEATDSGFVLMTCGSEEIELVALKKFTDILGEKFADCKFELRV